MKGESIGADPSRTQDAYDIWTQLNDTWFSMSSRSSVDRATARCSGGHGFDSCRRLRIFFCQTLLSCWSIQLSQTFKKLLIIWLLTLSIKTRRTKHRRVPSSRHICFVRLYLLGLSRNITNYRILRAVFSKNSIICKSGNIVWYRTKHQGQLRIAWNKNQFSHEISTILKIVIQEFLLYMRQT